MPERRLSRRAFVRLASSSAITSALLAACARATPTPAPEPTGAPAATTAPKPAASPTPAPKTSIRYWTWLDSADQKNARAVAQKQILDAFRQTNPNIELAEEVVPWQEIHKQLLQATAANKAPDVCRILDAYLVQLSEAGALLPLDEFVSGWSAERRADYVYDWSDTVVGSKKIAFRQAVRPNGMLYYRTDLLGEAGFKSAPRTLKELTEAAKATTKGNIVGFQLPLGKGGSPTATFQIMYWCFGTDVVDRQTGKALLDSEAGIKIHQWLQDMVHVHKAMPSGVASMLTEPVNQVFMSGAQAMILNHTSKWAQWKELDALKGRIDVAPPPNYADDASKPAPADMASGWTLVMARGAKKEAAWKLMEHLQSNEAELIDAKVGGELPTRKSTLKDPFFQTPDAAKMKEWMAYMAANLHQSTRTSIKKLEVLDEIWIEAAQQIVVNKADVKSTLADAVKRFNSQL